MVSLGYEELSVYYGDLHSHCDVGYGHGSMDEAYENAQLQLDFACVTPHAHWMDIPSDEDRLESVIAYHEEGFRRTAELWPYVEEVTDGVNRAGQFVSFLGFEWHSMQHGDHNVYFKGSTGHVIPADDIQEMRGELRLLRNRGIDCFMVPHHIGYLRGYRGINWEDFSAEFSPVVEIFSMHGLAESDTGPYPYLHTMGPRDSGSTMQRGLELGNVFGVIGSSDHHSAHPGSYGHGRMGVWAEELSREGIWRAIVARRTYALTGDQMKLTFSINGQPIGSLLREAPERVIEVSVIGGGFIDYVEVLHNNRVIQRSSGYEQGTSGLEEPVKLLFEVGWGQKEQPVDWQVTIEVMRGSLLSAEPRFRGRDIVQPESDEQGEQAFSKWRRMGRNRIHLTTRTWGNPTTTTAGTQGICLEVEGGSDTLIGADVNGRKVRVTLGELLKGSRLGYLEGFLSPAYCLHRAIPRAKYTCALSGTHRADGMGRDWYYVRVRQMNGHWAWSTPIWVDGAS
jgi:hypothetical protein